MNRVVLINRTKAPNRDEISTVERSVGDLFFTHFDLEYAGYITVEGAMKLAPQWIVPAEKYDAVLDFVETYSIEGYEARLYSSVITPENQIKTVRVA